MHLLGQHHRLRTVHLYCYVEAAAAQLCDSSLKRAAGAGHGQVHILQQVSGDNFVRQLQQVPTQLLLQVRVLGTASEQTPAGHCGTHINDNGIYHARGLTCIPRSHNGGMLLQLQMPFSKPTTHSCWCWGMSTTACPGMLRGGGGGVCVWQKSLAHHNSVHSGGPERPDALYLCLLVLLGCIALPGPLLNPAVVTPANCTVTLV